MAAIELSGVSKTYGRHRGIDGVELNVGDGEVFGYLGPNGAGKTTTIRLLLDLIRPSRGAIAVLGRSPRNPALRRRIGYLAGELALYDRYSGGELLTFLDGLRGGGSLPYGRQLAERLDLDLSRPIGKLSKGNKQKVGVVQALMHRPELLILDEPTSGLDPLMQQVFLELITEHRAAGGTTFLSSHVLSEVERIAQRVGIIRDGKLVEVATLDEFKRRAVRVFEITFDEAVSPETFAGLPSITDIRMVGRTLHCRVTGSVDPLVKAISAHRVANIVSFGADLEALFLTYYRGGSGARNVFLKTIRDRRRGLIWWSLGVFVFALFVGLFWPILRDSQEQLQAVLSNFPQELFGLFGVATVEEMFTPAGYLSSRAFGLLVPVVFAIYATGMGAQLIAGEEEARTMDLLLANPISRERTVWHKWLALATVMAILGLALLAAVVVSDIAFGLGIPFDRYFAASFQVTLLGILFGSLAFAAGALGARRGLILGVVSAVAVAAFLVNSLGTVTDWMERVRVLSPFYYYDSNRPLVEGIDWLNVAVLAAVSLLLLLVALWAFPRRDVRV